MAVRTVSKRKGTRTCASCGSNLGSDEKKCHNCNSSKIKKTLIVVKKTESDGEDAHAPDPPDEEEGEEESEEDDSEELSEEDFEPAEEEDDSEDDESEEDDEEEEEEKPVTKRIVRRRVAKSDSESVDLDIAMVGLTVMEDISKAVSDGDADAYEAAMTTFNNVCDEALESWTSGESIAKEDKEAKLKRLKAKLAALKSKLGGNVEKSDDDNEGEEDIFKGLSPAAAAILKNAQEIQERDKISKYEGIAKSFGELPTSETELGAALRILDEADKDSFKVVEKALKAAAEAQKQSSIFKSYGSPQHGDLDMNNGGNLESIKKSYQDKDSTLSDEQAYGMALRDNPHLYDQMLASANG